MFTVCIHNKLKKKTLFLTFFENFDQIPPMDVILWKWKTQKTQLKVYFMSNLNEILQELFF